MRKDEKSSMVSHEIPMSRNSSYGQAVLNGQFILMLELKYRVFSSLKVVK